MVTDFTNILNPYNLCIFTLKYKRFSKSGFTTAIYSPCNLYSNYKLFFRSRGKVGYNYMVGGGRKDKTFYFTLNPSKAGV